MAFTILTNMAQPGPSLFYDPAFRLIIETHLNILKSWSSSSTPVDLYLLNQYEGDFYGYLVEMGITPEYHWIYLRVNGMTNPNQFGKEQRDPLGKAYAPNFIQPNPNLLNDLTQYYNSRKF